MNRARLVEIGGGAILVLFGLAFGLGGLSYELGSFDDMGPGMFPLIVGLAIAAMGVPVVVMGLVAPVEQREDAEPGAAAHSMRVLLLVSGGIFLFGLLIRSLGMFPAVIGLALVVGLTERERRPVVTVATAVALAVIAWLIFTLGLGMNIPAFRWGF